MTEIEHRRIITGPINVRDWQVICLCGARIKGPSAKAARAAWEKHATGPRHHARPNTSLGGDRGSCVVCGAQVERTNGPGMGASFRHVK